MMGELFRHGDPVLWVIIASGVLAFGVFLERSLHLHRARIRSEDFLIGVLNILRRGNMDEALTICEETPGPVAYVTRIAILRKNDGKEMIRAAVQDASLAEISRMERRLMIVATVAQLAPLLGLLGTVLGLLETLMVMDVEAPLIQTADVMHGAFRALGCTAAGLMVAIPCYAGFNVLVLKIDRIVLDMERAAVEVLAFLEREHHEKP